MVHWQREATYQKGYGQDLHGLIVERHSRVQWIILREVDVAANQQCEEVESTKDEGKGG